VKARTLTAALLVLTAGAAFGGDAEFDRILKAIESRYGTKPTHIPLMGVANFVVKVARPEGTSGFKLAVFEGLNALTPDFDRFMDTLSGPTLRPLVRVHSRHNAEATYIFLGPESKSHKSTRVLIATFARNEATVVEVQANIETLLKSLEEPGHAGERLRE
jgi:hypothetical protein